jgi:hypothetical protein
VGEIYINSPSKAQGYWKLPEPSIEEFQARVPHLPLEHPGYLRTGDLGFLHAAELFICGRRKDLIIVRGSNHYPQDIERTAEAAHANIRPGCSAAFSFPSEEIPASMPKTAAQDTEHVVLVAEVREELPPEQYRAIVEVIKRAVSSAHGVALSYMVLLRSKTVRKTTSGKIARAWNRRAFLDGSLNEDAVFWYDIHTSRDMALIAPRTIYRLQYDPDSSSDPSGASTFEIEQPLVTTQPGQETAPGRAKQVITREEIESMSDAELLDLLELDLVVASSHGVEMPLKKDVPLAVIGLDSLSLVQFKGMLEGKYGCQVRVTATKLTRTHCTNRCRTNGYSAKSQH